MGSVVYVRGRKITCNASNPRQKQAYITFYSGLTDEELDRIEDEDSKHARYIERLNKGWDKGVR